MYINHAKLLLTNKNIPAPQALSVYINADPNVLASMASGGTRDPADKISNYVYINSSNLIVGQKYCYFLGTAADYWGNRTLANGTVISSKAYNGGSSQYDYLSWNHVKSGIGAAYGNSVLSSYGTITYNPKTIVAGNGSSAYGHKICGYTYNASDPGKGNAKAWIFDYDYIRQLFLYHGITFVDNNNNAP